MRLRVVAGERRAARKNTADGRERRVCVRAPQEVRRELAQQHDAELEMVKTHLIEWLQTAGAVMGELAAIRRDLSSSLAEEQVERWSRAGGGALRLSWSCSYLSMHLGNSMRTWRGAARKCWYVVMCPSTHACQGSRSKHRTRVLLPIHDPSTRAGQGRGGEAGDAAGQGAQAGAGARHCQQHFGGASAGARHALDPTPYTLHPTP